MTYSNERVLIRPKEGNVTKSGVSVVDVFNEYVNREDLWIWVYDDQDDGNNTYKCTILALGDLIENTDLNYEDLIVTDLDGKQYYDLHSLIFDSEDPYNEVFNGFSARDWAIIYRALAQASLNGVHPQELEDLKDEIGKVCLAKQTFGRCPFLSWDGLRPL